MAKIKGVSEKPNIPYTALSVQITEDLFTGAKISFISHKNVREGKGWCMDQSHTWGEGATSSSFS